jgi:butyrate kinase
MKQKDVLLLVINTGSTSTKLAIFRDGEQLFEESVEHSREEIGRFGPVLEQAGMRKGLVVHFIEKAGFNPHDFDAIASRGGAFGIFEGGGYVIDDTIINLASKPRPGFQATASWLAVLISGAISKEYGIPAYFYDAVRTDELCEYARYSGISFIKRQPGAHPLNTKEVGRRVAEGQGRSYEDCNFLICHLGGGISVEMHHKGRMIDKIGSDEGAFTPERAGNIPNDSLVDMCFLGEHTQKEINAYLRGGRGGLVDYLGTNDMKEVETRIQNGDKAAEEILCVMAYMVAKDIGAMATTVSGRVDNIIFTGGIARSELFTGLVHDRVGWIAPIVKVPGSFEMEALAHGVLRIYREEERAKRYTPH